MVLESDQRGLIGIEVKAARSATKQDARHLEWLRDESGERFRAGIVFHTGIDAYQLGDRIWAMPIAHIWR